MEVEVETVRTTLGPDSKRRIKTIFIEWLENLQLEAVLVGETTGAKVDADLEVSAKRFLPSRMNLNAVVSDFVDCVISNFGGTIPQVTIAGTVYSPTTNFLVSDIDPIVVQIISFVFYPEITYFKSEDETVTSHRHGSYASYYLYALKRYVQSQFTIKHHLVETEAMFYLFYYVKKLGTLLNSRIVVRTTIKHEGRNRSTSTTINPITDPPENRENVVYSNEDAILVFDGKFEDERNSKYDRYYCTSFWTFFIENLNFCELTVAFRRSKRHGGEKKWIYNLRNCLESMKRQRTVFFEEEEEKEESEEGRDSEGGEKSYENAERMEAEEMNIFSSKSLQWLISSQNLSMLTTFSRFWVQPKKLIDLGRVLNRLCHTFWFEFERGWEIAFSDFALQRKRSSMERPNATDVFFRYIDQTNFWLNARNTDIVFEKRKTTEFLESQKRMYEIEETAKKEIKAMWISVHEELGGFDFGHLFRTKKCLEVTLNVRVTVGLNVSEKGEPNDAGTLMFSELVTSSTERSTNSEATVYLSMVDAPVSKEEKSRSSNETKEKEEEEEEEEEKRMEVYRGGFKNWEKNQHS
jgi:hypothetical protein